MINRVATNIFRMKYAKNSFFYRHLASHKPLRPADSSGNSNMLYVGCCFCRAAHGWAEKKNFSYDLIVAIKVGGFNSRSGFPDLRTKVLLFNPCACVTKCRIFFIVYTFLRNIMHSSSLCLVQIAVEKALSACMMFRKKVYTIKKIRQIPKLKLKPPI